MGLLDEILKQLEEAQQEAEGRPRSRPAPSSDAPPGRRDRPERETDEDGAEWEREDETRRPGHAPHIPARTRVEPVQPVMPEPAPTRTTTNSRPAMSVRDRQVVPAERIRSMLSSQAAIRDLFVAREILGPPPGLKHFKRR